MDNDLTLLFVTAGERPAKWVEFHEQMLQSLPYPKIVLRDEQKMGEQMIYQRMLEGAKQCDTPYVAVIEDDVLYPIEHFWYRPDMDTFAYNQHRWALFVSDGGRMYSMRQRKSNCSLIAPRELLIESLEERFEKNPNGWAWVGELGRHNVERKLGVTPRKSVEWYSKVGLVQFNHSDASEDRQRRNRKEHGQVRAFDIPTWGKSSELVKLYC